MKVQGAVVVTIMSAQVWAWALLGFFYVMGKALSVSCTQTGFVYVYSGQTVLEEQSCLDIYW